MGQLCPHIERQNPLCPQGRRRRALHCDLDSGVPQFESVEDLRRVRPGQSATLIPSWNTGFPLRAEPREGAATAGLVRPGQKLVVVAERDGQLQVEQEAEGLRGWIPAHVVTRWPEP